MIDRYRRAGSGPPRAILATMLVAVLASCAPSHMLTPAQCAAIGAGFGAAGGAAGGAEYANENSTGAGVGIGVAGTVAGAAIGWGLCRLLQPSASELESEPESEPAARVTTPEPPSEPVLQAPMPTPIPEAVPAPPPPAPADPCAGTIELPGLRFALGQSVIRLESFETLDLALERLTLCPDEHVRIEGHSDSTGPDDLNQRLSRDRAAAVRTYIVEAGIDSERVTSVVAG